MNPVTQAQNFYQHLAFLMFISLNTWKIRINRSIEKALGFTFRFSSYFKIIAANNNSTHVTAAH